MTDTLKSIENRFETAAEEFGNSVSSLGNTAADAMSSAGEAAADRAGSAADRLRAATDSWADSAGDMADRATGVVDRTAKYLRDRKASDMLSDFTARSKANPTAFLLGALAVGFIAGRLLRRT